VTGDRENVFGGSVEDDGRILDEVLLLASELDALTQDGEFETSILDHLSYVTWTPGNLSLLAALWLRAGLVAPRQAFLSAWSARPIAQRLRLATEMLTLQPATAVRVLGPQALVQILAEVRDSGFHGLVAQAMTLCRFKDGEHCLAAMLPEAQFAVAPYLAESAAAISTRMPEWLCQLSPRVRRSAIARFALGAVSAANEEAFVDALDQLDELGLYELVTLLEQELRRIAPGGILLVARHSSRLPKSDPFAVELCTALVHVADYETLLEDFLDSLSTSSSARARTVLAARPTHIRNRLSQKQQVKRHSFWAGNESFLSSPQRGRWDLKVSGHAEPQAGPITDLASTADAERLTTDEWAAIKKSISMSKPVRRAQLLSRLAPAMPADWLPAFGVLAAELQPSEWQRHANASLFNRALALGIDPWSVVKKAKREDAIAALIGQRLREGELHVLGHRAWLRLNDIQKLTLLRLALAYIVDLSDSTQRVAWLDTLCGAISRLPAPLGIVMAIQVLKRFSCDSSMTPRHVRRLTEIGNASLPQREELFRATAMAFWLRGEEQAGADCHAEAEACVAQMTKASLQSLLHAPEGSDPEAGLRCSAAAVAVLEAGDPNAPEQIAACLFDLEPERRDRFIAHLIVQGQAAHVLMTLGIKT
jgi:hypothetical protein